MSKTWNQRFAKAISGIPLYFIQWILHIIYAIIILNIFEVFAMKALVDKVQEDSMIFIHLKQKMAVIRCGMLRRH